MSAVTMSAKRAARIEALRVQAALVGLEIKLRKVRTGAVEFGLGNKERGLILKTRDIRTLEFYFESPWPTTSRI